MSDDRTLRIERRFQAPAEAVFDAFTSEEVLRRWWYTERGWETTEAEVDLRVGGVVRVAFRDPDKGVEYAGGGRYTEIDPPTRLAFTWIWDGDTRRTLIEVDFEEADGATTVRFTHRHLWDEDAVREHAEGWTKMFDHLAGALATSTTLEVVRFTVALEGREAFLRERPAAIAALQERFPGLLDATLAELDDGTWIDVLRWRSRAEALDAAEQFSSVPEAAAWASRIADVREMLHGEVRDVVRSGGA